MRRESLAFWCLCFYLMIEYVRPQSIYRQIDVLPWGQTALGLTLVASFLEPPRKRPFIFLDGLLVLFTAIVLASIAVAYSPSYALSKLTTYINWLLLYYLTTRIVTTERRLFIFFLTFLLWSFKMSQHGTKVMVLRGFSFAAWGASGAPGWFQNSGEFAIQMVIMLAMTVQLILGLRDRWPKWKTLGLLAILPGTAGISLIASSSRGGQLAGAVALLVINAQSRRRWRGFAIMAVLLPTLWYIVPPEQKARFSAMGDDKDSQARLTYWKDGLGIMMDHPVLGVGYFNWSPYYHQYYNPEGEVPHNIFIEAGAQMGYTGLLGFLLLIGGTLVANARTRRRAKRIPEWGPFLVSFAFGLDAAMIGYLVAGFFVTVLFYPFFWMNLSFTAAAYLVAQRGSRRARPPRRWATPSTPAIGSAGVQQPTTALPTVGLDQGL